MTEEESKIRIDYIRTIKRKKERKNMFFKLKSRNVSVEKKRKKGEIF